MSYLIIMGLFINILCSTSSVVTSEQDECNDIILSFSSLISQFTKCSVQHARPIGICEYCVDDYILILDVYRNLSLVSVNNTLCIDKYTNLDRLGIIDTIKNDAVNLWNKAYCDDCYMSVNNTLTNQPSRFKLDFDSYRVNFSACINWYQHENDTVVCKNCLDSYLRLNAYYFSKGNVGVGAAGHCMDIVDWMNSTQSAWSKRCCKYRRHDELILKFAITFAGLLPLLFYLTARYFGGTKRTTILSQNRFAESINAQLRSATSD